ncbi:MAG: ribosome small subunit-dependent GTPase A [Desulfitobacteriaceae bacterium]|nr:ribosome small subunit-dependent GTPase A [Desulfitobacteriaceae bacterium]
MTLNLQKYGLDYYFVNESAIYVNLFIARVSEQHREQYKVITEYGELSAVVSGKLAYHADGKADFPAVGDWVMIDRIENNSGNAIIHHILSRKSRFTRKVAGIANEEQIIAANIDTIFICMSLNADFNLRRLERYLTIAWDSMATPVIVLTKSDLCEDVRLKLDEVTSVAMGVDVVVCSAENSDGLDVILTYIQPGKTIAFIGSSGVGKSTLINRLIGRDILATKQIREDDDKGRHTTTHRQLLLLPNGGIAIDTPGMRELQIFTGDLSKTFEDIDELALGCKYKNCTHDNEPGCVVRQAIKNGILSEKRFESYLKLQREMSYEGLNARQRENEKINRMFGSKAEMKQAFKKIKGSKKR